MRIFLVLVIFTALSIPAAAQINLGGNINNKIYVGGGFDFNMGTDRFGETYTYFSLSPLVGYNLTPKTSVGTILIYNYYHYQGASLSLHQFGFSPFVRHQFTEQFFGYAELDVINTPTFHKGNVRRTYTRGLLGAGYSHRIGESRGVINVMALYDVLYRETDRAFSSPWAFRIFFTY